MALAFVSLWSDASFEGVRLADALSATEAWDSGFAILDATMGKGRRVLACVVVGAAWGLAKMDEAIPGTVGSAEGCRRRCRVVLSSFVFSGAEGNLSGDS